MSAIRIENKRTYSGPGQYIGRPSPLGNPYIIGRDGSRTEVIAKYKKWLWQQLQSETPAKKELLRLARVYAKQHRITLVCWCAPDPCHGDVIASALEQIVIRGESEWAITTSQLAGISFQGKR